jgi:uncharacterized membrane protein
MAMAMTMTQRRAAVPRDALSQGLGWLSVGLGVAELSAPRQISRWLGVRDSQRACTVVRALGVREIASGAGLLASRRASAFLWSRVAGDVMDLALLGTARPAARRRFWPRARPRTRLSAAAATVAGVALLDGLAIVMRRRALSRRRVHVHRAITINRPADQIYAFWRRFDTLPRFMDHLESVRVIDDRRSRWRARAPAGTTVEWEAEILRERPNELISWRSLEGSDVETEGSVLFAPAPGGKGTEVHVQLDYHPPGGRAGAAFARLFGQDPAQQVAADLRKLKQILEAGEIPVSDGSLRHPARPPAVSNV